MNRRSALRRLTLWLGAIAAVGLSAPPAHASFYFFKFRFRYYVHRRRRRLRWRCRR